jgi:hypothetical protein
LHVTATIDRGAACREYDFEYAPMTCRHVRIGGVGPFAFAVDPLTMREANPAKLPIFKAAAAN